MNSNLTELNRQTDEVAQKAKMVKLVTTLYPNGSPEGMLYLSMIQTDLWYRLNLIIEIERNIKESSGYDPDIEKILESSAELRGSLWDEVLVQYSNNN